LKGELFSASRPPVTLRLTTIPQGLGGTEAL
jgi:hypothetical protein